MCSIVNTQIYIYTSGDLGKSDRYKVNKNGPNKLL